MPSTDLKSHLYDGTNYGFQKVKKMSFYVWVDSWVDSWVDKKPIKMRVIMIGIGIKTA